MYILRRREVLGRTRSVGNWDKCKQALVLYQLHFALLEVFSRDHGKAKASDGFVEMLKNETSSLWLKGYRESEKVVCRGKVKAADACTSFNAATNTLLVCQWTSPFQG